jgi:signal transduction histidine kinase
MNPITAFFVRNIVAVFFVYGLAFFAMGLALALAARRPSELQFAQAIRPLAAFGLVHGIHEWFEMFQKVAAGSSGHNPTLVEECVRLAILVASFLMLAYAGLGLLRAGQRRSRPGLRSALGMFVAWSASVLGVALALRPSAFELMAFADVLSRYLLGIPGALLAAWGFMKQQRAFREEGMPQFGRDLLWCATALFLYGVLGQAFVRETVLPPSNVINATRFVEWFGIPVQLFRGAMATMVAVFMARVLNAFELEGQHRTLQLSEESRLAARELSWLLDLSNVLSAPMSLQDRLDTVLKRIVEGFGFPDAGIIALVHRGSGHLRVRSLSGLDRSRESDAAQTYYSWGVELAQECVATMRTVCRHLDGRVFGWAPNEIPEQQRCRKHRSPAIVIAMPLSVQERAIGSIVLFRQNIEDGRPVPVDELRLMVGTAQQLGLSIENARLYQEAQEGEQRLAELLRQAVGAQEAERQRIARELHDVTGQSLTAIALGLGGVETSAVANPSLAIEQVRELKSFGTTALGELRQIIADLRPPQLDDLGLVPALQWYVQGFEKRQAIRARLELMGDRHRLPAEYETVLFRVAQEALTNVARHASASEVSVTIEVHPSLVRLTIEDNGLGFDTEDVLERDKPAGWGLLGIQERASLLGGECEIDSALGRGTRVRVTVPVTAEAEHVQDSAAAG